MNSNNENVNGYQRFQPINETVQQDKSVDNIDNQPDNTKLPGGIEVISIYNIRSKYKRYIILVAAAMIASLLPFSDTVYLPALRNIESTLNTSVTLVAITMSIYLLMSGVFSLIWGSASDRFGRKITLIIALLIFTAASIVCIFAASIAVLIIFRAVEGMAVSATFVVGQSMVADIYPEETRGTASGVFFVPFNVGPIIGPLIGGPLSAAFGWPSTFVFLAIYSFVAIVVLFILIPETHQYFVKERFNKKNPTKCIIDAVPNEKPSFEKPWKPLVYLADLTIVPYIILATICYAILYASFTLFSIYLTETPYNYTTTMVGLLYVPSGVALFTGGLLGGWLSDKASNYFGHEKCYEGRLVPALVFSLLTPIGSIIFGWIFQYQSNISGAVIGHVLLSFGQAAVDTIVSAYLTIKKQEQAGAMSAIYVLCNLLGAGFIVTFAVPLSNVMGPGFYFSFLSALNFACIIWAGILVDKNIRRTYYILV